MHKVEITEEVGVHKETITHFAKDEREVEGFRQEARQDVPRGSILTIKVTEVDYR